MQKVNQISLIGTTIFVGFLFAMIEYPEIIGRSTPEQRFSSSFPEFMTEYLERRQQEQEKPTKIEGFDQSKKWCLNLFDEEAKEELGYFKGDFLDELVCREDFQNMIDELGDVPYEKVQAFFDGRIP